MSKSLQRSIPFAISPGHNHNNQEKARKHNLIVGRPRRLRAEFPKLLPDDWDKISNRIQEGEEPAAAVAEYAREPEVIKVAISPSTMVILDRIRNKLAGQATRPDAIRIATDEFVQRHRHLIGSYVREREKRVSGPGRCQYLKVPFPISIVDLIGHQEDKATGLCAVFGATRQGVISRAIRSWIQENK